jgi:hypothetical protein
MRKREESKDKNAVNLGKKGGKKGGPARAAKLTPQQRKKIASQGGKAKGRGGSK